MKQLIFYQKGVALVLSVILLLVLTLLVIAMMNMSSVQEKMSHNLRDSSTAFNAAEAALGDGEKWLSEQKTPPIAVSTCLNKPCRVWVLNSIQIKNTDDWWDQNGIPFSSKDFKGVYSQPHYLIEEYSVVANASGSYRCYRVNARGVGTTKTSNVNLQSIYCLQF